eukprot:6204162-Pleurochrysis_carterae.AAC.6
MSKHLSGIQRTAGIVWVDIVEDESEQTVVKRCEPVACLDLAAARGMRSSLGKSACFCACQDHMTCTIDAIASAVNLNVATFLARQLNKKSNHKHKSWYVHTIVFIVPRQLFKYGNTRRLSTIPIESRGGGAVQALRARDYELAVRSQRRLEFLQVHRHQVWQKGAEDSVLQTISSGAAPHEGRCDGGELAQRLQLLHFREATAPLRGKLTHEKFKTLSISQNHFNTDNIPCGSVDFRRPLRRRTDQFTVTIAHINQVQPAYYLQFWLFAANCPALTPCLRHLGRQSFTGHKDQRVWKFCADQEPPTFNPLFKQLRRLCPPFRCLSHNSGYSLSTKYAQRATFLQPNPTTAKTIRNFIYLVGGE